MPEQKSHQQRVKQLLAQDPEINDTRMKEFRMQLEQALELSEAKATQTRRRILILLIGLAVYFVVLTVGGNYLSSSLSSRKIPLTSAAEAWRVFVVASLIISTLAAAVIGVILVLLYFFNYRPRLNRARFDLQTAIMEELQQQVNELRSIVERRLK